MSVQRRRDDHPAAAESLEGRPRSNVFLRWETGVPDDYLLYVSAVLSVLTSIVAFAPAIGSPPVVGALAVLPAVGLAIMALCRRVVRRRAGA